MGLRVVRRDPEHHGTTLAQFAPQVSKSAGFLGAAGRVVLRIEVDDHVFAPKIRERNRVAGAIFERELWSRLAFLYRHLSHPSNRREARIVGAANGAPQPEGRLRECPPDECPDREPPRLDTGRDEKLDRKRIARRKRPHLRRRAQRPSAYAPTLENRSMSSSRTDGLENNP